MGNAAKQHALMVKQEKCTMVVLVTKNPRPKSTSEVLIQIRKNQFSDKNWIEPQKAPKN